MRLLPAVDNLWITDSVVFRLREFRILYLLNAQLGEGYQGCLEKQKAEPCWGLLNNSLGMQLVLFSFFAFLVHYIHPFMSVMTVWRSPATSGISQASSPACEPR